MDLKTAAPLASSILPAAADRVARTRTSDGRLRFLSAVGLRSSLAYIPF